MRHRGRITSWNDNKGYGFLTSEQGDERVFLHISAFTGRHARPKGGEVVTYLLSRDARNRARALDVRYADRPAASSGRVAATLTAAAFLATLGALSVWHRAPAWTLVPYLLVSVVSLGLYHTDKSSARAGGWRTPESVLHLWDALGGWPGGLIAQQWFRHKNRKPEFQFVFWLTVVAHLGGWAWYLLAPISLPGIGNLSR